MFADLTFEEIRELDSKLLSGLAKAEHVGRSADIEDPMLEELADVSNDADRHRRYFKNVR